MLSIAVNSRHMARYDAIPAFETGSIRASSGTMIMEYRNGNMFGMTAFTSYGFFWISLIAIIIMPELGWIESVSNVGMASYLAMWGLFTAILSVSARKFNYAILTVFITLTLLFFLLAIGLYNPLIHRIAGYEGILCGFTAIYVAFAELTNNVYGRSIIPLWPTKK